MKQLGLGAAARFTAAALLCAAASSSIAAGVVLRGAGATFPSPIYAEWAAQYQRETGVEVRYEPVGSDAGIAQLERRQVDFGGSDLPLTPAARQRAGVMAFPAVIGGVVPVVNIKGIASGALKLTGPLLADIYLGRIRRWDDPAIAAVNPELDLPGSNITVCTAPKGRGRPSCGPTSCRGPARPGRRRSVTPTCWPGRSARPASATPASPRRCSARGCRSAMSSTHTPGS